MAGVRTFADAAPVAFVDIETTGGQAAWHRITEIAIIGVHGDEVDFEWSTLVNPGVSIPPSITQLTGIDDELVRDAPPFEAIAAQLRERLEGRLFVAHNVRFDYHFIRGEFQRAGQRWQAPQACTARLSRRLFPLQARHNLDTLIAVHGLAIGTRHRAMPDAQALWQFWRKLRREWPLEALDQALDAVSQTVALPPQLPPDLADELPERPGVYRFLGEAGGPIYIGKANNLRERVLSHFGGAHRDTKSRRLTEQTVRVEWSGTAGELGALLQEASEVRALRPVYNRRLRTQRALCWRWPEDQLQPSLADLADGAPWDSDCFGLYKSERDAHKALRDLAAVQRLCVKALGLEAGAGSCFAFQLQRCRGACVGREPAALHAVRARLAMARWKLRDWPYRGPVAVIERGVDGGCDAHVLDRWCHRGTVSLEPGADPLTREELLDRCRRLLARGAVGFNADVYRILAAWMRRPARGTETLPLHSGTMHE